VRDTTLSLAFEGNKEHPEANHRNCTRWVTAPLNPPSSIKCHAVQMYDEIITLSPLELLLCGPGALGCWWWNFFTALGTFCKCPIDSHEFWPCPYPCHETKYWSFLPWPLNQESNILQTFQSISPADITTGGGGCYLRTKMVSWRYGSRSDTWHTLWIRSVLESCSWYTNSDNFVVMEKGPKNFDSSFLEGAVVEIWSCRRSTLSPIWNWGCCWYDDRSVSLLDLLQF